MLSLNIQGDDIFLKDIKLNELKYIYKWYNNYEEYKYATGVDYPISFNHLVRKYNESILCLDEFFVGIYSCNLYKMIGVLKGKYINLDKRTLWIRLVIIESGFQRKGYGQKAVNLLINHFKSNKNIKSVCLAVAKDNIKAIKFWHKQGFEEMESLNSFLELSEKPFNPIVMCKYISQ
ncbi:UNVERIFIED_CONTAM: ribosomal protein S18 acetylase RimI-like enzyme [Acetivibrio alkalicellulosi]